MRKFIFLCMFFLLTLFGLAACGGSGSSNGSGNENQAPSISIDEPTSASSYSTTWSGVIIGGTISGASFVHVKNELTGFTTEGFVNYYDGHGSWFAEIQGLGLGNNQITVTADANGTGVRTADAHITIIRPLQPADLIINGPDQASTSTFWTDMTSFGQSHMIILFGDGTGRSTTGSALSENAGIVADFTWSKSGPDSIIITNCLTCSFQEISRIQGSFSEGIFDGQIVTIDGAGEIALHSFSLSSGNL